MGWAGAGGEADEEGNGDQVFAEQVTLTWLKKGEEEISVTEEGPDVKGHVKPREQLGQRPGGGKGLFREPSAGTT